MIREDGTAQASDDVEVVRHRLFAELDDEQAVEAHSQFVLQSMASLAEPCSAPPRSHPTTYVICEHDQAFPPDAQEAYSQRADHVVRLPCSHAASVVMPEAVAAIVDRAVV